MYMDSLIGIETMNCNVLHMNLDLYMSLESGTIA